MSSSEDGDERIPANNCDSFSSHDFMGCLSVDMQEDMFKQRPVADAGVGCKFFGSKTVNRLVSDVMGLSFEGHILKRKAEKVKPRKMSLSDSLCSKGKPLILWRRQQLCVISDFPSSSTTECMYIV